MDNRHIVHIDLDSLLDTRMGTISLMDLDAAEELLKNDKYRNRVNDDIHSLSSKIDNALFQERYKRRNIETLQASRLTGMVPGLSTLLRKLVNDNLKAPMIEEFIVHLNISPYLGLTSAEKAAMVSWLNYYIPTDVGIEIVELSLKDLTPQYIKRTYAGVILYDLDGWLKLHIEELAVNKMPKVTMMVPVLHQGALPSKEDMRLGNSGMITAPQAFELLFQEFVEIVMLDTKYFSIIDPEKIK